MQIAAPESELRANLARLAECPSPLKRLGIKHTPRRIAAGKPGEITITIPSGEDSGGSKVHFEIDFDPEKPDEPKKLTWTITLARNARELDLGENRLLNPLRLNEDLEDSLRDYANYFYQRSLGASVAGRAEAARFEASREAACRKFGRIADGLAIVTDANLRAALERQKRRDALGWLFSDSYQLKTDSPEGSYWEAEQDYQRNADPYGYNQ